MGIGSIVVSGSLVGSDEVSSALVARTSDVETGSFVVAGKSSLVSGASLVSTGALVVAGGSDDVVTTVDVWLVVVVVAAVVVDIVVVVPAVVEVAAGGFTLAGFGPVVVVAFGTSSDTAASPPSANARSQADVSFSHAINGPKTPPKQTTVIVLLGQKPGLRRDLACRGSLVFVIVSP